MINWKNKKNIYVNQFSPAGERCLLPLAAGILASCIQEDSILNSNFNAHINIIREDPYQTVKAMEEAAVLCFSAYAWNFRQSQAVAKLAKGRFPNAIVIFGGPSVPRYDINIGPFFKENEFIDIIVHGEGERTLIEILYAVLNNKDCNKIAGLSFRCPNHPKGYVTNDTRDRINVLNEVPSPFLNGVFDNILKRHKDVITGTIWETNRGCPFQCTFCDWGQATQARVNIHHGDRLIEELNWISANKIPYIFSADANFGIKERDLEIAQYIAHLYQTTGYPRYMLVNWMKNSRRKTINIANAFKKAGFGFMVTLSVQSFDKDTLEAIKRSNIELATFAELKEEYNKMGINTYSELLLGLPGETYESFSNGLIKALSPLPSDHFALYLTNVLPNAEMAKPEYREKYGIETRFTKSTMLRQKVNNYHIPEMDEIVVGTKTMPPKDWAKSFCFGYFLRAMHNMRLAFYIIEFLREAYNVSPKDYVEYLIAAGQSGDKAPVMAQIMMQLSRFTTSILNNQSWTLTLDEYPDYYWEPHEMSFLMAYKFSDKFYDELRDLTKEFMKEYYPGSDQDLINEICIYQEAVSPINKATEPFQLTFKNDLLEYDVIWADNKNDNVSNSTTLKFESVFQHLQDKEGIEYPLAIFRAGASGSVSHRKVKIIDDNYSAELCAAQRI